MTLQFITHSQEIFMFHRTAVLVLLLLAPSLAHIASAHPEGHQSITDERAIQIAGTTAAELTERDAGLGFGKLDSSWKNLPAGTVKIHVKRSSYYIVSLANEAKEKTLYVLMSNTGEVNDANFTGEFPGLDE
mgnify:CR=1 FL=1